MKQARWLSEFRSLSEYTRLYPTGPAQFGLCSIVVCVSVEYVCLGPHEVNARNPSKQSQSQNIAGIQFFFKYQTTYTQFSLLTKQLLIRVLSEFSHLILLTLSLVLGNKTKTNY